mmetsp:Transcript_15781/g.24226  ORF Transcript_15781/g.24226 Transcript_15781/m.24226 type:complete len:224 (-) Transcript_15781:117-788(-)
MLHRVLRRSFSSSASKVTLPTWTSLATTTKEEWMHCSSEYAKHVYGANNIGHKFIQLLESQRGDDQDPQLYGCPVDLYQHGLQTATRAYKDGASEEVVVAALFHDTAEYLAPYNHGQAVANMLCPYVSPAVYWLLSHHDAFQTYYFLHHSGKDNDLYRGQFKTHPHYDLTVYFCENYDQNSFDANYEHYPLSHFEPLIERFFKQQPFWWNDGINPQNNASQMF